MIKSDNVSLKDLTWFLFYFVLDIVIISDLILFECQIN